MRTPDHRSPLTNTPLETLPSPGRPVDLAARRRHVVVLPERFDVHRVPEVTAELDRALARGGHAVVDGSRVRMIDLAAIGSTLRLLERRPDLRIERPSVALRVTVELTAADRIAASLESDAMPEAA